MGLGFAFNVDPLRGASTPVLGQLYMLLVTLTFLALNGHLVLIETLAQGFTTLPVGMSRLRRRRRSGIIAAWGSQLFAGALAVALPGMTALLVVNLAFGVMSRAAPTLNLFAVGFPVTLIAGLVIVYAGLPSVQASFVESMEAAFHDHRCLERSVIRLRHGDWLGQSRIARSSLSQWPVDRKPPPWPSTPKNAQNKQHLSASRKRGAKARFRVRAISAPPR